MGASGACAAVFGARRNAVARRLDDAAVADALALFADVARGARSLARDDVERVLVESDVPLRCCDELCDAFLELSLDGSGEVTPTAFCAGVVALRRGARRDLVRPVLEALDPDRTGKVAVAALADALAASVSARDSAGHRAAAPDARAAAEIRGLVAALGVGAQDALSYDAILDLLFDDEGTLLGSDT